MKKIILLFIAISIFGCSKDSISDSSNNVNTSLKLIQINEDRLDVNFGTTTKFTYTNGLVSKREYSQNGTTFYDETTNFNYVDGKLKSLSYYHQIYAQGVDTYTYTGDLISSCYSTQNSTTTNTVFTYNASNQMIMQKFYDNLNNYTSGFTYEYDILGNLFKNPTIPPSSSYNSIYDTFNTYDNQKNPYSLIYSDAVMKIELQSKNNNTKKTEFNGNSISVYEYLYNSNGFPSQMIEKKNGTPYLKTTYTYQ